MIRTYLFIFLIFISLAACNSEPASNSNAHEPNKEALEESKSEYLLELANFTMSIPEGWKQEAPSSRMRVAQLYIEEASNNKITVFFFGSQEMVDENIQRWREQFTREDDFKEMTLTNNSISAVKIIGTFKKKDFPMATDYTETPGYGTLAAIVPSNMGPYYFKLSAPKEIIEAEEASFIEMMNSFKIVN